MGTGSEPQYVINPRKERHRLGACPLFPRGPKSPPENGDRHRRQREKTRKNQDLDGASPHFRAPAPTVWIKTSVSCFAPPYLPIFLVAYERYPARWIQHLERRLQRRDILRAGLRILPHGETVKPPQFIGPSMRYTRDRFSPTPAGLVRRARVPPRAVEATNRGDQLLPTAKAHDDRSAHGVAFTQANMPLRSARIQPAGARRHLHYSPRHQGALTVDYARLSGSPRVGPSSAPPAGGTRRSSSSSRRDLPSS